MTGNIRFYELNHCAEKSLWIFRERIEQISCRKWVKNLIEYWFRWCFITQKKIGAAYKKIPRDPHVLIRHITLTNFFKEILARNDFFFYFSRNILKKMNEKPYLILISFFFQQNFEWENGSHNFGLISRSSFCYTGFTEWYVFPTLGEREGLPGPLRSSNLRDRKIILIK